MTKKVMEFSTQNKRKVKRTLRFTLPPPPREAWSRQEWEWWPQLKPPGYDFDGWDNFARSKLDSYLHSVGLQRLRTIEEESDAAFSAADVPYLAAYLIDEMLSVPAQAALWYDPLARVGQPGTPNPREARKVSHLEFQGRRLPLPTLQSAATRTAMNLLVGSWEPHRELSPAQRRERTAWLRQPVGPEPDFGPAVTTPEDQAFRKEHGWWPPLFRTRGQRASESGRRGGQIRRERTAVQRLTLLDLPAGLTLRQQAERVGRDERTIRRWWDSLERDGLVTPGSQIRPAHGGRRDQRLAP